MDKKSTRKISIEASAKLVTYLTSLEAEKRKEIFEHIFQNHGVELKINAIGMLIVKASKPNSATIYDNLQALSRVKEITTDKIFEAITSTQSIEVPEEEEEVSLEAGLVLRHKTNTQTVIKPKTANQKLFMESILKKKIVFGMGAAGTGKTFLATAVALRLLQEKRIQKIIISRPAVSAVEDIGFLPGSAEEKLQPFMLPILSILAELIGKDKRDDLIKKGVIEILPLGFARGITIGNRDGVVGIFDEAQNMQFSQYKLILTRLGSHPESRLLFCGDNRQSDLGSAKDTMSILNKILGRSKYYESTIFTNADVVRSEVVKEILGLIEEYEDRPKQKK